MKQIYVHLRAEGPVYLPASATYSASCFNVNKKKINFTYKWCFQELRNALYRTLQVDITLIHTAN